MRHILVLVFCGATALANSSKELGDIMYFPANGKIFFELDFEQEKMDIYEGKAEVDGLKSKLTGGLSFAGKAFFVSVPYLINREVTFVSEVAIGKAKGLGDIELEGRWRVLDQKASDFNLDLSFMVSPKTGKAKSATDQTVNGRLEEGKNYRGGTNIGLGAVVGKKINKDLALAMSLDIVFNGERMIHDSISETSETSRTDFILGGVSQMNFANGNLFSRLRVQGVMMGNYSYKSEPGSILSGDVKYDKPSWHYGVDLGYRFQKNTVVELLYTKKPLEWNDYIEDGTEQKVELDTMTLALNLMLEV